MAMISSSPSSAIFVISALQYFFFLAVAQPKGPPPNGGGGGGSNVPTSSSPHAAAVIGDVAKTTVGGTVNSSGKVLVSGENIYGPFEAGFGAQQDGILRGLGCSDPSLAYTDGGMDTKTSQAKMAHSCGVKLPRTQDGEWKGLLDPCGGHTSDYHFHEKMICLYEETGNHSTKVGELLKGQSLYGKWEDFSNSLLPELDACGAHFGRTPESPDIEVYHYHVQDNPPFTVGCIGPNDDNSLVTVKQCREFYTGCDGVLVDVTTSEGTFKYDMWCPCFDKSGSNTGVEPVVVGKIEASVPAGTDVCQTSFVTSIKESIAAAASVAVSVTTFTTEDVLDVSVDGCSRRLGETSSLSGSQFRRLDGTTTPLKITFSLKVANSAAVTSVTDAIQTHSTSFASSFASQMQSKTSVTISDATLAEVGANDDSTDDDVLNAHSAHDGRLQGLILLLLASISALVVH